METDHERLPLKNLLEYVMTQAERPAIYGRSLDNDDTTKATDQKQQTVGARSPSKTPQTTKSWQLREDKLLATQSPISTQVRGPPG